jgi:hypothetical protein
MGGVLETELRPTSHMKTSTAHGIIQICMRKVRRRLFIKLWLFVVGLLLLCTRNFSQKCFVLFYLKWHGSLGVNVLNASHNWGSLLFQIKLPVVTVCMSCSTNIYMYSVFHVKCKVQGHSTYKSQMVTIMQCGPCVQKCIQKKSFCLLPYQL